MVWEPYWTGPSLKRVKVLSSVGADTYIQPTGASMVAARQCPALQNRAQVILPYEKGFEFLCTVSEAP